MPLKRERTFTLVDDRHHFDAAVCRYSEGWAQVDTWQDASYFGIWTSPERREILTYCEGDVTLETADTHAEYALMLRACVEYYRGSEEDLETLRFCQIDPGLPGNGMRERFERLGLRDLLPPIADPEPPGPDA